MSYLLNYLIAGVLIAYSVLVGFTIKVYFSTGANEVPKIKTPGYPIYMHGKIWFNILWIAVAVGFGGLLLKWLAVQLGGL